MTDANMSCQAALFAKHPKCSKRSCLGRGQQQHCKPNGSCLYHCRLHHMHFTTQQPIRLSTTGSCRTRGQAYLIIQVVVQVISQQQVDQRLLTILVMPQNCCAMKSKQSTAARPSRVKFAVFLCTTEQLLNCKRLVTLKQSKLTCGCLTVSCSTRGTTSSRSKYVLPRYQVFAC